MSKHENGDEGKKLKSKKYMKELRKLQGELCKLQEWVKHKGLRAIIIFEGRDAAGKGGTIKAITERVSPRVFRLVALPAPSDREIADVHAALHAAFSVSWRSGDFRSQLVQPRRGGIRHGLLFQEQHRAFLQLCPEVERYIVNAGIILIKVWLEVSDKEQARRFEARIEDPLRQWKLSPMDLPSRSRWFDYSRARDMMLAATDTKWAPWYVLPSDDKKRARLNCIQHILNQVPYKKVPREKVELPKRSMKGSYDDHATLKGRKFIETVY